MVAARHLLVSIALHAAVIGAAYCVVTMRRSDPPAEEEIVPIEVEMVEPAPVAARDDSTDECDTPEEHAEPEERDEPEKCDAPEKCNETVDCDAPEERDIPEERAEPEERDVPNRSCPLEQPQPAVVETAAEPIARVTPTYPRRARRRGVEGVVQVKMSVSAAGAASDAVVVSSSGSDDLDRAAVEAALGTRFRPGTRGGSAVSGEVVLTFDFRLTK